MKYLPKNLYARIATLGCGGLLACVVLATCAGAITNLADDDEGEPAAAAQPTATIDRADPAPTDTPRPRASETPAPTATATARTEPTPRPTHTPAPTATPEPTATPTPVPPTPTATPQPQPVTYTGSGANVIDIQKPGDAGDPALIYVRGNTNERHFAVESFDASGQQVDLLVNTTDPYEGVVLMDIREGDTTTRLQVTADGEWYIEIRPLAAARRISTPGTISGTSDDVFIIEGEPDVARIVGNAESRHFAVIAYGDYSNLLVNTTDPFDGRVIVAKDTVLVEVTAAGAWEITFE